MATGKYYLQCPSVVKVNLTGKKAPWVSAKDIILYILQQLTVKGGVNKIIEYTGDGVASLSLTDRATICNMGLNWEPLHQFSRPMKEQKNI